MKRLFIGLPIESPSAVELSETWRSDRLLNQNRLVWTNPDNWHITLFFLGNTSTDRIALLEKLIAGSFEGVKAFNTELNGVGVFPNTVNPKILWLGLENLQPLMARYIQLGDLLRQNGFSFDSKPLKPHLTLARIKSLENRTSFEELIKQYSSFNFGTVPVNRVVLYESLQTPQGPVYKPQYIKDLL